MTIDRRQLLGSAGAGIALTLPGEVLAASVTRYGALPMPAPVRGLPQPLPQGDPSRIGFDQGWLFHEGDIPVPPATTHEETYLRAKAGNARGAAAMAFDDSDWQAVTLPHDWASFQPFVESANPSQGYRPRGIGWYRRTFRLDPADRGKYLELQLDGIATNATIWINGSVVAHNWSGYNSVYIDVTPFARFGDQTNVVAIRVDADAMEGWWYEGAGLYRHAWLAKRSPVAIVTDGVHCDPRLSDGGWSVPVTVTARSIEAAAVSVVAVASLIDPGGRTVASVRSEAVVVPPLDTAELRATLAIAGPKRWSVEAPTLYTVAVSLERDGVGVDARRVPIGFRTVRFDADKGLFVNDLPVKLKGVCIHPDHAGVGVAVPDALLAWRLERLKELGCNAIRCSHNAPATAFLDLCDRMGFLVMDENRNFNPAPDYMAQLEWLVRRDRNHPSVILWSVFNEEPMQGTAAGVQMVRRMAAAVERLDDSRPVTAAMNGSFFNPENVSSVVNIVGFNYYPGEYDKFHALYPAKPITSSEDTSAFMTRGAYTTDAAAHVISSMDEDAAGWGETHRNGWAKIARRPFVAGGFVWTGFDYHGEPTPHVWPTVSSFFGILDLCGFRKTAYDIHRAGWIDDVPVVGIAPHWTWPDAEAGRAVPVLVMSNAERVVLKLNGRVVGEAAVDRLMGNGFTLPYAPGTLEVIAYRGGREVARAGHETAGPPVALRLTPARTAMTGDGEDVQPVTVDAVDARGWHVPTANLPVRFAITGGAIIGLGNGDPNSHEPEKGDTRSLFNGLAQAIVQADAGLRGRIVLRATAFGLKPASVAIDRVAAVPRPQVAPAVATRTIDGWRRSPLLDARPDPGLAPADGDNNSWAFVRSGTATPAEPRGGWQVYRARVTPVRAIMAQGGGIAFAGVAGRAELWVDGRRLADKPGAATGPIDAILPPGSGERGIVLIVETSAGAESGIVAPVTLRR